MSIGSLGAAITRKELGSAQGKDRSSIDRKIEILKKQLEELRNDQQLSPQEREKRLKKIEEQIEVLEKQRAQAVRDEAAVKDSRGVEDAKQVVSQSPHRAQEALEHKRRFDTFEHQPKPQPLGLYKLARDEQGKPVVSFDDPSKASTQEREKPQPLKTTIRTDEVEREIKKLRQSTEQLRHRLSSSTDPDERERLTQKLSQLERSLRQKDNDTYRRTHAKITEQRAVSRLGE